MTNEPQWRKSTFSGSNGSCVELAEDDDTILVRNSNRPDAGALSLTRDQIRDLVGIIKAGELDDLT